MLKPILLFLLLFVHYHSTAQFADSTPHHFHYLGNGSLNKTKTSRSYVLTNNLQFGYRRKKIAFDAVSSYTYGQQMHILTNNDFSTLANLDFDKKNTGVYYWALVNYQTAYSLQINYKLQGGGGIGYTALNTKKSHLSLSDGFLYEANDLTDASLGHDVYSTVRNSFRVKYRFIIDSLISLSGADFAQPSILSINDYIFNLHNEVGFSIKKWLNLNAALDYNRINRTKRETLLLTFGIVIDKFY